MHPDTCVCCRAWTGMQTGAWTWGSSELPWIRSWPDSGSRLFWNCFWTPGCEGVVISSHAAVHTPRLSDSPPQAWLFESTPSCVCCRACSRSPMHPVDLGSGYLGARLHHLRASSLDAQACTGAWPRRDTTNTAHQPAVCMGVCMRARTRVCVCVCVCVSVTP